MAPDAPRPPQSTDGPILGADIEGYARPDRNDPDRVRLRDVLQQIVWQSVSAVAEPGQCRYADVGDGIFIVFPCDVQKTELIVRLIPTFEQRLLEHNRLSAAHMKLRVRIVLELGEILIDKPQLTGEGLVGTGLNTAARLLGSDFLHSALRRSPERHPLALLVSDRFYDQVIRSQLAIFQDDYECCRIAAKDRTLAAWLWWPGGHPKGVEEAAESIPFSRTNRENRLRPTETRSYLTLADLPRTCIFVPTTDIHTHELYGMFADRVPLANHLETALLLGKNAIVHCSDPYRSVEVCELLESFREFIDDRSLLFLLGSSIQDVRRDFIAYLHRKARQYIVSGYGHADITSLSRPSDVSGFDERVVDLIDRSPVLLHRGYKGTAAFAEAVRRDLRRSEMIVAYNHELITLRQLNPTLFQILHLERVTADQNVIRVLASDETIERLTHQLEIQFERSSFSRQILLRLMQEHLGDRLPPRGGYYGLLAARITLLHLQTNAGIHAFIECTPGRDRDSLYSWEHLLRHVEVLSGMASQERFGVPLVRRLRRLSCWPAFVNYHLRVIAELHARRFGGLTVSFDERFADTQQCSEFAQITATVREWWA
jgi:class 3 adenylate cyclase